MSKSGSSIWKPSDVVPEQRGWAILVWIILLLTILGYTAWQIVSVAEKYSNPSTSFSLSNDLYNFPVLTVCMDDGTGCGFSDNSTTVCVSSALEYSQAHYLDESVNATLSERDNCIKYDLTQFDVGDGEKTERTSAYLEMEWISSDNSSMETEYITSVNIILGDIDGLTEDMMVPYSRNVYPVDSTTYWMTELTIGKTDRDLLSGSTIETFPVQTTSTSTFVTSKSFGLLADLADFLRSSTNTTTVANTTTTAENTTTIANSTTTNDSYLSTINLSDQVSVGSLFITLTQGSYSYVTIKDINPLELATIIGNIGGFWELLVLAWGVFFIASQNEGPTLKARKWSLPLRKGGSKVAARPQSNQPGQMPPNAEAGDEEAKCRPGWNDIDGLPVGVDEENGWSKRDLATNIDGTTPGRDDIDEDGCGTERGELKRVLPRMLARGDIFNAGSKEDSTRGEKIGGRARISFFLSKHSVLSSFKRSFRSTGEVSEEAEVDEEKNLSYDPCSSYGHTTVEGTNSRGDVGAWEMEVSEPSDRCDTYHQTPPRTVAM